MADRVFVFGSNEAGRHGKGAALFARENHGAIYGQGRGRQGASYAIPTKDKDLRSRTVREIGQDVRVFLEYARAHRRDLFELTPVGCGLAGYQPEDIAPLFKDAPANVLLPPEFRKVLGI